MIHLVWFHSNFQAFSIAAKLTVCTVVSAYFALSMAKNAPYLFRLSSPKESPAGVARNSPIMQMGGSRTLAHTAAGGEGVVFAVTLGRHRVNFRT